MTKDEIHAYQKDLYNYYKLNGICVTCGHNNAEPNRVRCFECLEKNAERKRLLNKKSSPKYAKQLRDKRKQNGLCIWCGKPQMKTSSCFCLDCFIKNQQRNQNRYRKKYGVTRIERREYGICYRCGRTVNKHDSLCDECLEISRNNLPQFNGGNEGWYRYNKRQNNLIFGR